ncbi:MAG: 30S ribosome-binding factor RbfA [Actinomycetota bacterium]|jgi:ribosome-binding factor A|nr:30S ribosome-binding factor RbfA [Actinomycetota bacterium]
MARARRRRGDEPGRYPRVARVNELCREIVADELERIDDDRLDLVTVTHVDVEPDLRHATVEFSRLGEAEDAAAEALAEHRVRLQAAIARQARLRRTPELAFRLDRAILAGARIEQLLREQAARPVDGGDGRG